MTERDQTYSQLTIDGGEVKHPPPRPRAHCPECGRLVKVFAGGILAKHNDGECVGAAICPRAGTVIDR